ncbi:MAG: hypothetical protein N3F04_05410 [Candidatus Nezhaarchaeota archaeon]|nr:hypothetical protein [Candidatus Nezhaarchaeota archaeon]MCX8142179.1 hypothetical protein [Candidatus Nezhaarchaeota archaeon]MDW8050038.1 hypothetical protein [Nitrososphaerota archaeon]
MSQVDIAPTIAKILSFPFECEGKPIEPIVAYASDSRSVYLVIVDSLGFEEYLNYKRYLPYISSMESQGLLLRCLSYSHLTTPSIATILCGLRPEVHRIMRTEDAYMRVIRCMPETAHEHGLRVAIVMEEYGALSFQGLVDAVEPIPDKPNALSFDEEACRRAMNIAREIDPDLMVVHFRSLDKLGFKPEPLNHLDSLLRSLSSLRRDLLMLVCGDHPPHYRTDENHVALVAFKPNVI